MERIMWAEGRQFTNEEKSRNKAYQEGFYIFGGVDSRGQTLNDLWLVKPIYTANSKQISPSTYEYVEPDSENIKLSLKMVKMKSSSGQPPYPRINASMAHVGLKSSGHQLLVVYGGRNDRIFDSTGNVALNDVCIYNCNLETWEPLAMFGQLPCSRWSHSMLALNGSQSAYEGVIIFGGVNLKSYCKSKFYQFTLGSKKDSKKVQNNVASSKSLRAPESEAVSASSRG